MSLWKKFWNHDIWSADTTTSKVITIIVVIAAIGWISWAIYSCNASAMDEDDFYDLGYDMGRDFGFHAESMGHEYDDTVVAPFNKEGEDIYVPDEFRNIYVRGYKAGYAAGWAESQALDRM